MPTIDTRGLLETDARFLAEDDRYVVIAVRVQKEILARNAPFLWAAMQMQIDAGEAAKQKPCLM